MLKWPCIVQNHVCHAIIPCSLWDETKWVAKLMHGTGHFRFTLCLCFKTSFFANLSHENKVDFHENKHVGGNNSVWVVFARRGSCRIECKTAVFFANASDGPYSNERLERVKKRRGRMVRDAFLASHAHRACEARALHTRGSRLRRFPLSENDCFAVYVQEYSRDGFRETWI